jgi:hypothetical protein
LPSRSSRSGGDRVERGCAVRRFHPA